MRIQPCLDEFRGRADAGARVIPVFAVLQCDDLTPMSVYRQLCGRRDSTFLLESAEQGVWSRWSFVGVNAQATLVERGGEAHWLGRPIDGVPTGGDPLVALARTLELLHTPAAEGLPPLTSGMVGYLGYDTVRRVENLPDTNPDDLGIPELTMMLASDMAAIDHHRGEIWLIANAVNFDDSPSGLEEAHADAIARVQQMAERLARPQAPVLTQGSPVDEAVRPQRQRSAKSFGEAVGEAVEHIRAGDAFQVVVSQRFDLPTDADALDVYRELRAINPSPYLYLLRLPGFAIVGSSPEALVTVKDGHALTHPIAGSRPRGADELADHGLEQELLGDAKERAEHLMLVDLGRNDLGRVCAPGTVTVTEFMSVRRYSHIMHLESTVTGEVAEGRSALDVTMACFPAGTLSGAPKVRAMEIIDELELSRRGLYGGTVGYFDFAGNSDMAIAIRTALIKDGMAHVQAGGGIVADSVAETENLESENKAAAALRAVHRAGLRRHLDVVDAAHAEGEQA